MEIKSLSNLIAMETQNLKNLQMKLSSLKMKLPKLTTSLDQKLRTYIWDMKMKHGPLIEELKQQLKLQEEALKIYKEDLKKHENNCEKNTLIADQKYFNTQMKILKPLILKPIRYYQKLKNKEHYLTKLNTMQEKSESLKEKLRSTPNWKVRYSRLLRTANLNGLHIFPKEFLN